MTGARLPELDASRLLRHSACRRMSAALVMATALGIAGAACANDNADETAEPVVVLHGLARTAASMGRMARALEAAGFDVCNVAYPSRRHPVATLAGNFVGPEISACFPGVTVPIHFVTHSLGGIIARELAASGAITNFGRVVMLSPPNNGSEVVDKLGHLALFRAWNGPAGSELGTGSESLPRRLGPAQFSVGVITGTRTINPILSLLIPGTDDGKVSADRARLEGMSDFLLLPASHPFIMNSKDAIRQTIHFLKTGSFEH